MNKFIKKMKYFRKGAITIEFIIVVSILVLIAGFGTTFIYNQFSGAKDKMNKVGDVMLNGDIFNSEGGSANLSEEVEMINITEADTDWQVGLIGETENYQIEKYKGNDAIVTVPGSYKGCPIVEIGNCTFYGCSGLTSITIPPSVKSIGEYAFYNCSSLTNITIPSSVTNIEDNAFGGCSGLTSIVVDSDNGVYDSRNNCNAIIETTTNTLISGCKNTIIPSSVTKIGDYAFYNCSSLTSIAILSSVTSIRNYAFSGCSGLTSITIPSSVTSIERRTFCNCSSLTNITIPYGVTSIGNEAFQGCSSLTNITIPSSVTNIESSAFGDCSGLTNITIPSTVTSIEDCAFCGCSGLTSIAVDSNNSVYDSRNNCNAIIETATNTLIAGCKNTIIPSNVTSIEYGAFYKCSSLTSVTIPNNVKAIGDFAFFDCSNLKSIIVPESVTSIGMVAFYGCTNLKEVIIKGSNVSFSPPVDTFTNCSPELKFYVPKGTLSNYSSLKQYGIVSESN